MTFFLCTPIHILLFFCCLCIYVLLLISNWQYILLPSMRTSVSSFCSCSSRITCNFRITWLLSPLCTESSLRAMLARLSTDKHTGLTATTRKSFKKPNQCTLLSDNSTCNHFGFCRGHCYKSLNRLNQTNTCRWPDEHKPIFISFFETLSFPQISVPISVKANFSGRLSRHQTLVVLFR